MKLKIRKKWFLFSFLFIVGIITMITWFNKKPSEYDMEWYVSKVTDGAGKPVPGVTLGYNSHNEVTSITIKSEDVKVLRDDIVIGDSITLFENAYPKQKNHKVSLMNGTYSPKNSKMVLITCMTDDAQRINQINITRHQLK